MDGAQGSLSNNGFQTANCFCCLSQNATVCLAHCRQELPTKVLKNCNTFSSRPRPRPNVQDQDFHFFVLETPRDQDPGLEDYITAKSTMKSKEDKSNEQRFGRDVNATNRKSHLNIIFIKLFTQ